MLVLELKRGVKLMSCSCTQRTDRDDIILPQLVVTVTIALLTTVHNTLHHQLVNSSEINHAKISAS